MRMASCDSSLCHYGNYSVDYKGEETVSASLQRTFRTERKAVFDSFPQSGHDLFQHGVDFANR